MSLPVLELLLILSLAIAVSALVGVFILMKRLHDVGILDNNPPSIPIDNRRLTSVKKSPLRF